MSAEFHDDNRNEKESYSFLKETIKKPPLNKKAVFLKILKTAGLGIIFGLGACIGFSAAKPWIENHLENNPTSVTIPQDDQNENTEEEKTEEEAEQSLKFTVQNYQEMLQEMNSIVKKTGKSLVELEGTAKEKSTESGEYVSGGRTRISGVIVADNGVEFLILADNSIFQENQTIRATFYDGNSVEVSLKKQDRSVGIAVYAAEKASLPSNTQKQAEKAVLGNSNTVSAGDPVIAVGMPFGTNGSVAYGIVSETVNTRLYIDSEYQILNTDMPGDRDASGVLLDMNGQVLGLICRSQDGESVLSALAISELKEEIELLSNGIGISYTGIDGMEVSDSVANSQEMPKGVYVNSIVADSPAMKAGIKNGDIITEIGNTKVYTVKAYREELLEYRSGTRIIIKGKRKSNNGYVDVQFEVELGSAE